jgi:predicted Rossmann-fold nucleotide-binding protein
MNDKTIDSIKERKKSPLIAVIGATDPTPQYKPKMGIEVGYFLRKNLEDEGTIFTGGVSGIGIDVYEGAMNYCKEALNLHKPAIDRFFVLVPENHYAFDTDTQETYLLQYRVPEKYFTLARSIPNNSLDAITAGVEMSERRQYLAELADVALVLNGGGGTLDEAFSIMARGKNVITLPYTGGAARLLQGFKEKKLYGEDILELEEKGVNIGKILQIAQSLDFKLLKSAENPDEMLTILNQLVKK